MENFHYTSSICRDLPVGKSNRFKSIDEEILIFREQNWSRSKINWLHKKRLIKSVRKKEKHFSSDNKNFTVSLYGPIWPKKISKIFSRKNLQINDYYWFSEIMFDINDLDTIVEWTYIKVNVHCKFLDHFSKNSRSTYTRVPTVVCQLRVTLLTVDCCWEVPQALVSKLLLLLPI